MKLYVMRHGQTDWNVLLVTHGGTARVINSYFEGKDKLALLLDPGFRKL